MCTAAALLLPACGAGSRDESRPLAPGDVVSLPAETPFAAQFSPELLEDLTTSRWRIERVDLTFDPATVLFPTESGWTFNACALRVPLRGRVHLKLTEERRDEIVAEARPEIEDRAVLLWGYRAWEAAGQREGEFVLGHCRERAIEIVLREPLPPAALPPPPSPTEFVEDGWTEAAGVVVSDRKDRGTTELNIGDGVVLGAYSWNGPLSAFTACALTSGDFYAIPLGRLDFDEDISLWPEPVWFFDVLVGAASLIPR
jgi:hypothetical protein